VTVSRTDPNATECLVKGLQEDHSYVFRVKAVNDEGESQPLESSTAFQAKDPYGEITFNCFQKGLPVILYHRNITYHVITFFQMQPE
jgi:hypothetical protein